MLINHFEKSYVKTFCFTRTLSQYTRTQDWYALEGLPWWVWHSGAQELAKFPNYNLAEQGYVKPHQTHRNIRIPSEQA